MGAIPSGVDTDAQPPMAVPLRHFVVGFGFLLASAAAGIGVTAGLLGGLARLGYLHLLLVGWVCVTIMGAMTQFVPVWSGVTLHSRRLANLALLLVVTGLVGLATGFLGTVLWPFVPAGLALVAGIWTFVYNLGRTLAAAERGDATEFHFAVALAWFGLLAPLGLFLAVGFGRPGAVPVARPNLVEAHATVAVFGAVLTTVAGALYQLATMFTQTDLDDIDRALQRYETAAYPVGVLALAGGRLVDATTVAAVGGVCVTTSLVAVAVIVGRRLAATRVERTPMLTRYALVTVAVGCWAAVTTPAWLDGPLGRDVLLGAPGTALLLVLGVAGFVVFGTLYHAVPFIVWVHRYSDRLGFEEVPLIDDLYDGRVAAADCWLLVGGVAGLVAGDLFAVGTATLAGGVCFTAGSVLFVANMLLVLYRHSRQTLRAVVVGGSVES